MEQTPCGQKGDICSGQCGRPDGDDTHVKQDPVHSQYVENQLHVRLQAQTQLLVFVDALGNTVLTGVETVT
eukprot:3743197-Amphidinium_carterae.1